MKYSYLLCLLALGLACQRAQDTLIGPATPLDAPLTDLGVNNLPINFGQVTLSARSSVSSLTITGSWSVDPAQFSVREVGFCFSETDSLPQLTNPDSRRLTAVSGSKQNTYTTMSAVIDNPKPNHLYYFDPYLILKDGRVFYGRYNTAYRSTGATPAAASFRLPERPTVQPVQIVRRATVPTPPGAGNTSPIPNFHNFVTLRGRLYSFYPTGDVVAYDAAADRWDAKASLGHNVFVSSYTVFAVNDRLYVKSSPYSNYGEVKPASSLWEYDPQQNSWTDLSRTLTVDVADIFYAFSSEGKAYFTDYKSVLAFDAGPKQVSVVNKPTLLTNGRAPYLPAGNGLYYANVWIPDGNTSRNRIVHYDPATDQLAEETELTAIQAQEKRYYTRDFFTPIGQDLVFGYGSTLNPVINQGCVGATGTFFRDELLRYSLADKKIMAYYDLSGIPNSTSYYQKPVVIGNRLFVFNTTGPEGLFTEVIFP